MSTGVIVRVSASKAIFYVAGESVNFRGFGGFCGNFAKEYRHIFGENS